MACVVTEVEPALLWILTRDDSSDTLCHSEHSHFLQSTSSERGEHLAKQILDLYNIFLTSGADVASAKLRSMAYNPSFSMKPKATQSSNFGHGISSLKKIIRVEDTHSWRESPGAAKPVRRSCKIALPTTSVRQSSKLAVRILKSRSSANPPQSRSSANPPQLRRARGCCSSPSARRWVP